jgi:hypothetical protein
MTIGERGATVDEFARNLLSREFDELRDQGLIVFWPDGQDRPIEAFGMGTRPGAWYLTQAGAQAIGLEIPPIRWAP